MSSARISLCTCVLFAACAASPEGEPLDDADRDAVMKATIEFALTGGSAGTASSRAPTGNQRHAYLYQWFVRLPDRQDPSIGFLADLRLPGLTVLPASAAVERPDSSPLSIDDTLQTVHHRSTHVPGSILSI